MNKKLISILGLMMCITTALWPQVPYNVLIKGDVRNVSREVPIKLLRWDGHAYVTNDSTFSGRHFSIKTRIESPELAFLQIGAAKAIPIFLASETFLVTGDIRNSKTLTVRGSQDQVVYNRYLTQLEQLDTEMEDLETKKEVAERQRRSNEVRYLEDKIRETTERRTEVVRKFALSYSYSLASAYIARGIINYLTASEIQQLIKAYEVHKISDASVDFIKNRYEVIKNIQEGHQAPEFSLPTNDGEMIALSDFRGKYVLIDFWASWCYPCRKEMHNTVKLYHDFKDHNFTIFGVSLDTDKNRWLRAVKEDQMPWVQVRDVQGDRGTVAEIYALGMFPQNVLIDPQGVIVAKNLSLDDYRALLKERLIK